MEMCDLHCGQYLGNGDLSLPPQGRTQDRADGAKAPPEILRKKLFTHLNPEHFMFRSFFILLQIMFPRFN